MAVVQTASSADRERNIASAARSVAEAAARGARLVALPEKWPYVHGPRTREGAEPLDGPSLTAARGWARTHDVAVLAGSVIEEHPDGRARNTSVLIAPGGAVAAIYRKLHMFDVDVGGVAYRESAATAAGDAIVTGEVLGHRVGLSVCYDLRFPELYRRLALEGATILAVPAAFTAITGRAHWETLLRARAIENQCFVLAPGQWGRHDDGTESHGHSMVVGPWGDVLAEVPDGEGVALADLDFAELARVRERLPALRHRRQDVYGA